MATRTTAAVPATGMATSRGPALGLWLVGIAIAAGGCGTSGNAARTSTAAVASTRSAEDTASADAAPSAHSFAWLHPARVPKGWQSVRLVGGATLAYPRGWSAMRGDRGTATAGLLDGHRRYEGYLNLTPRQGAETQANWRSFRVRHNAEEGERAVTLQASAAGLGFRVGRGACVRDAYTTATSTRYVEIACLVRGAHASSVIVGAAPSSDWQTQAPVIERAISAFAA